MRASDKNNAELYMSREIHLYTASTMNSLKPVIFLEEAGKEFDLTFVDFSKNEQKST